MAEIKSIRVVEPSMVPSQPGRVTNQLKYLLENVLPELWEHPYATPFLKPVDAVSLNIPNYYDSIINPMDLGTIKKRLESKYYWSAQHCIDDFALMFQNCYKFYPKTDRIIIMAEILEKAFGYAIGRLPKPEVDIEEVRASRRSSKKRKAAKSDAEKRRHKRKARKVLEEPKNDVIMDHDNDGEAGTQPDEESEHPSPPCDVSSTSGIVLAIESGLASGSDRRPTSPRVENNHQPILPKSVEFSDMAVDSEEPETKHVDLTLPWKLIPLSIAPEEQKVVKEYQFLPWKLIPITFD